MKTDLKQNISEYLKAALDKYKYVFLVCAVGLALALWPWGGQKPADTPQAESADAADAQYDAEQMARALETAFESIEGVGRVKIMLTVKTGYESVYVYDQSRSEGAQQTSTQTQLVTVSGGGEESPVVRKTNYPVFLGAVVICDGGENPKVRLELTQAVKSLTGITADNIIISKMKN